MKGMISDVKSEGVVNERRKNKNRRKKLKKMPIYQKWTKKKKEDAH